MARSRWSRARPGREGAEPACRGCAQLAISRRLPLRDAANPPRKLTDARFCRRAPHDGRWPGAHQRCHRSPDHRSHAGAAARTLRAGRSCQPGLSGSRYCGNERNGNGAPAAQTHGARQNDPRGRGARQRPCARRRLRHGIFVGGAGAAGARGGGARGGCLARAGSGGQFTRARDRKRDRRQGAVDRRLAAAAALRRDLRQRRSRNRAARIERPARGRRTYGCGGGPPPTSRAMVYRSAGGDVSGWPVFDAAAPLLPGFAEPPAFVF